MSGNVSAVVRSAFIGASDSDVDAEAVGEGDIGLRNMV
jgi:hypothetical protein